MVTVCALVIKSSKPRNWIAKDLRTPKYRCRVETNKKQYKRKEKHRAQSIYC
jgi:stalled ribosome alternative rescue factor ArfA